MNMRNYRRITRKNFVSAVFHYSMNILEVGCINNRTKSVLRRRDITLISQREKDEEEEAASDACPPSRQYCKKEEIAEFTIFIVVKRNLLVG